MTATKPYGNPKTAQLLVVGHDPRLQASNAEAQNVFFLDNLEREPPRRAGEKHKYGLARSLVEYIDFLSCGRYGLSNIHEIYFTNLCNKFLNRPQKGTVLIPDEEADIGIAQIEKILEIGSFRAILPMSVQVFYHLVKNGFVPNDSVEMQSFLEKARPKVGSASTGAYNQTTPRAFVDVCGNVYYHQNIPVVPILHVQGWKTHGNREPYKNRTAIAVQNVTQILG